MPSRRYAIIFVLALLALPMTTVGLLAATGGTVINETDKGISMRVDGVPAPIVLRTLAGAMELDALHIHPSLRSSLDIVHLDVEAEDWPSALAAAMEAMDLPYRIEDGALVVAPRSELANTTWIAQDGRDLDRPSRRQLAADVHLVHGSERHSLQDLILTEDNWAGLRVDELRLNVRPRLMSDDRVLLEFALFSGDDDGPSATPALVTRYGSAAVLELGAGGESGDGRLIRIEITPRRI